jgi:hypothetical protein
MPPRPPGPLSYTLRRYFSSFSATSASCAGFYFPQNYFVWQIKKTYSRPIQTTQIDVPTFSTCPYEPSGPYRSPCQPLIPTRPCPGRYRVSVQGRCRHHAAGPAGLLHATMRESTRSVAVECSYPTPNKLCKATLCERARLSPIYSLISYISCCCYSGL